MRLPFHYVYLVTWDIPNSLNEKKKKNPQGFGCLYINEKEVDLTR